MVSFSWGESPCGGATDYGIYRGLIGDWFNLTMADCHDDGGDLVEVLTVSPDSSYYLVVPNNAEAEGSYGTDSDGLERPPAVLPCVSMQDLGCS